MIANPGGRDSFSESLRNDCSSFNPGGTISLSSLNKPGGRPRDVDRLEDGSPRGGISVDVLGTNPGGMILGVLSF